MDFSFTEDQTSIQKAIRQILTDLVTDESLKALEKGGSSFHEAAWKALAEAEMLGLALPEAHGGADLGFMELCLLLGEVGRAVAPLPALPTLVSAALPIAKFGSESQKTRLLQGVASGEAILSAALAQVGHQDPKRPSAKAVKTSGGYALTGQFTNVPFADRAVRILLGAEVEGEGVGVFLLDPRATGVRLGAQRGTSGERLALVTLEGAEVAVDDVLAGPERGDEVLSYAVDRTLAGMCAIEHGIAVAALQMTARYATERKQFGMPIGAFQAVKQRLADAYIDAQAMEVTMLKAAYRLARDEEASREVAVAKFWAAEGGARVLAAAQHIHGGMGFDRDYPLHRYFLQSKHLELGLGGAGASLARLGADIASRGIV
jgi:3-oxocholest-4-en-26-oyl-CoA dehydrogenase beta subunit